MLAAVVEQQGQDALAVERPLSAGRGGLCRDAGESALAAALEFAGTVCALLTALPLLRAVLELVTELR